MHQYLEKLFNKTPTKNPILGTSRSQSLTQRPTTSLGIKIYNKRPEKFKDMVTRTSENFKTERETGIKTFRINKRDVLNLPYDSKAIRSIPFRRKYVRDKVFFKGIKQSLLTEKRSLSKKDAIKKIELGRNQSHKTFMKEAWNTNISTKLKLQRQLQKMGKLKRFGDVVNAKVKKLKTIRKHGLGGKIFYKNQIFDKKREKKVENLMERFKDSEFVKELYESRRKFKWEKHVEKEWGFKEELINYDVVREEVRGLEEWEKEVV